MKYLLLIALTSCFSIGDKSINDFKKEFNTVRINNIAGKFRIRNHEKNGMTVFDFISNYTRSISYISPPNNVADTIIIDNLKYPLDRNNCLFYDTMYSHINLKVLDEMSIYEICESPNDYLVFESVFAGATGEGINIRLFVVFSIMENKIQNKIVLSSWFGDSANFIKSKSQRIEFLKFEPVIDESSIDTSVYEVKFIDVIKLEDSNLKYKVFETYDEKNAKHDYIFEKVEGVLHYPR